MRRARRREALPPSSVITANVPRPSAAQRSRRTRPWRSRRSTSRVMPLRVSSAASASSLMRRCLSPLSLSTSSTSYSGTASPCVCSSSASSAASTRACVRRSPRQAAISRRESWAPFAFAMLPLYCRNRPPVRPRGYCGAVAEVTYLEAIRSAMADAMREDERVFLIGEDVGHFGGPVRRLERTARGVRRRTRDRHADRRGGLRRRRLRCGLDGRAARSPSCSSPISSRARSTRSSRWARRRTGAAASSCRS